MDSLINDFSFGLFIWMMTIFIGLIFLMKKFAWKPILAALDEREQGIENALAAAEQAKLEMANLEASNAAAVLEAREQRDEMLKEARQIKEKMIADAAGEAQAKADKIIEQAQENIAAEKKAALADIKSQVANLSVDIAEKVTRKELSEKEKQHALIEQLLEEANI